MRKVFLVLCIAFVVLCYAYPCFVLPFGTYKYEETVAGTKIESTLKFHFDGTVDVEMEGVKQEFYYKLKGNEVILSVDKNFKDDEDTTMPITSMYSIADHDNLVGQIIAGGVGVAALVLVLTIPRRR